MHLDRGTEKNNYYGAAWRNWMGIKCKPDDGVQDQFDSERHHLAFANINANVKGTWKYYMWAVTVI